MTEVELRRHFVARMGVERRDCKLFIRNVGNFEMSTGGRFRSGIAGQADVYGWVRGVSRVTPLPLEVELKNVRTPHTTEQIAWQALCKDWGIPYLLLRAEKNASPESVIETWVTLASEWLSAL